MVLSLPTAESNADAVQRLLESPPDYSTGKRHAPPRKWEQFLAGVAVPPIRVAKPKSKGTDEDEAEAETPKRKFDRITMSTGLKFMFLVCNTNLELKHDVLQFFSSMLRDLQPLDFQTLEPDQGALLDQLEHYLAESITKDADLQDLAHGFFNRVGSVLAIKEEKGNPQDVLDLFIGLVNVRGSLSTNVLLARILATKPELLTRNLFLELRKVTGFSHAWLRPEPGSVEELVAAWKEMVLPDLKRKFNSDPQQAARKYAEIEKLVKQERTEEAEEALNAMLREGEEDAAPPVRQNSLPTLQSLSAARTQKGVPVAEKALSSLESKLGAGEALDSVEACAVVLALLDLIAERVALPRTISKKDKKSLHLPHLVGDVRYMRSICDLLSVLPSHVLSSSAPDQEAQDSHPCYAAVVQGVVSLLQVNLEWIALSQQSGSSERAFSDEEREALSAVERVLRGITLQQGDFAGASVLARDRGRQKAADAYSVGMPFFFTRPKAILGVLEPLMEQARTDKTISSPLRMFCSTIVSRIARPDLLLSLLKTEEGDGGKEGSAALAPMLDALVGFVMDETHSCKQSGVPPAAMWPQLEQQDEASSGEISETWVWSKLNPRCIEVSNGGLACQKVGGGPDYSVALGNVGFSDGTHKWDIKILNAESMFVGVAPLSVDVDQQWSTGMTGWHNGGDIKGHTFDTVTEVAGYDDGDVLTLVLDFEEDPQGRLALYKNGKWLFTVPQLLPAGATELYPMVQFDYSDHVVVQQQVQVVGTSDRPEREHLAVACAGTAASTLTLLSQELEQGRDSLILCRITAGICARLLKRLEDLLDLFLESEPDTSMLPIFDGLLGFTRRGTQRSLLGFFPLVAVVLSKLLALPSNKLSGSDRAAQGLSMRSLVDVVSKLQTFVDKHTQFSASFGGRCFRSFDLSGLQPHNSKQAEIILTEELAGPWTLEILVKRTKMQSEDDKPENTLMQFDLDSTVEVRVPNQGQGAKVQILWEDNFEVSFEEHGMPLDAWVSLCFVNTAEQTTLFIDGVQAGAVDRTFSLKHFVIGGGEREAAFHGMVRRVRVWSRAITALEAAALVTEGEEGVHEGWVATVDLVQTNKQRAFGSDEIGKGAISVRGACTSSLSDGEDDADAVAATPDLADDLEEPHWLVGLMQSVNGVAAVRAAGMVRGKRQTEEDAACMTWMRSPVFGQGIGPHVLEEEVLAAAQTNDRGVLNELIMPKFGIRLSPVLDAMERVILVAALHHCGVLRKVMGTDKAVWPASLLATTRNIAQAARGVRRHVQTTRDLANQALKDDEDPQPWDFFCQPIVDKCKVLLRVPSMCHTEESVAAKTAFAAAAFVDAGMSKAVKAAASAFTKQKALHAHTVYKRMWSQGLGKSREKKVMDGVQGFLKDDAVSSERVLQVAEMLMGHVSDVQEGLAALQSLMQLPGQLRADALCALAKSENAEKHYLEDLMAVGKAAEEEVRRSFHGLAAILIDILQSKPTDAEAVAHAACALTVKLDRPDLSELLATRLPDVIDEILQQDSAGWQGWGASARSVTRLLCSLTLQVASDAGSLSPMVEYWFGESDSVDDPATVISLSTQRCGLSVQNPVSGVARMNGKEYNVQGFSIIGDKYTLTLTRVGDADEEDEAQSPCLTFTGTLLEDEAEDEDGDTDSETAGGEGETTSSSQLRSMKLVAAGGELEEEEEEEDGIDLMRVFCTPATAPAFKENSNVTIIDSLVLTQDAENSSLLQTEDSVCPTFDYIQIRMCGLLSDGPTNASVALGLAPIDLESELGRTQESIGYLWNTDEVLCGEQSSLDDHSGSESAGTTTAGTTTAGTTTTEGAARKDILPDDTLGCRVRFEGEVPRSVEWSVNGRVVAARDIPDSVAARPLHFSMNVDSPAVVSSQVCPGGAAARAGVSQSQLATEAVRRVLASLRSIAHTPAVKRALSRPAWRATLWSMVQASGLDEITASHTADVTSRSSALQVLTASLLDGSLLSEDEIATTLQQMLALLVSLSPEASVLDFLPPPGSSRAAVAPSLPLRQQLQQTVQHLQQVGHCKALVASALTGALKAGAPKKELFPAVLAAAGGLDQVLILGGEGGKEPPMSLEVVAALLAACKDALAKDDFELEIDGCVVRTRMLKALWDLSACEGVHSLFASMEPLLEVILSIAQRRSLVPIMVGVGEAPQSKSAVKKAKFQYDDCEEGVVCIDEDAGMFKIIDRSLCLDIELQPGTGKHYAEFRMQENPMNYFYVGIMWGPREPAVSNPMGCFPGSMALANDGDFRRDSSWDCHFLDKCAAETVAYFSVGDHVGVLVDMDGYTASFYKNGQLVGTTREFPREPIIIGVGSSDDHVVCLVAPQDVKFEDGRQFLVGSALSPSGGSGPWLTMEALIAKSHALCVEVGRDALAAQTAAQPSAAVVPAQDPLARLLGPDQVQSTLAWSRASPAEDKALEFAVPKEVLLSDTRARKTKDRDGGPIVSDWPTTGNKTKMLLDTEEALSVDYCRLIVLQLLKAGVVPLAKKTDASVLLDIVLPLFPPGCDQDRVLFTNGPYASLVTLLDEALVGWIRVRGEAGSSEVVQLLKQLTGTCLHALQRESVAGRLMAAGISELSGAVQGGPVTSSPSVVTWIMPKRLPIASSVPANETALTAKSTMGLASWLSRHLFKDYGLGGRNECSADLGLLMEGLLEALTLTAAVDARCKFQDALSVAIPSCGPNAAAGWGARVFSLLRVLRKQMVQQLRKELQEDEGGRVLCSPMLQSLCATVIAADLAAHGVGMRRVAEGFVEVMSDVATATDAGPLTALSDELMTLLREIGFSETKVQLVWQLMGKPSIESLDSAKGNELLDKLQSSDENDLADQVAQQDGIPQGAAAELDDMSRRILKKLEALTTLSQTLRCLEASKPLPLPLVDMAKAESLQLAQVSSWDDRDSSGGMAVTLGCRRAHLRPSVPTGQWGSVLGNAPLAGRNNYVSVRVERKPIYGIGKTTEGIFSGAYVGIMLVDGDKTDATRQALLAQGYARGCVVLRAMGQSIMVVDGQGNTHTHPASTRFVLGSTIGIGVSREDGTVHFFIQQPDSEELEVVGSVKLPWPSSAALPFLAFRSQDLRATFVRSSPPDGLSERGAGASMLGPLRAFPGRNTLSQTPTDWDEALDPDWPRACDGLVVDFAEQYAAQRKVKVMTLTGEQLFPDKTPEEEDGLSLQLERQTSRLPPAVRAASFLSTPSVGAPSAKKPSTKEAPNLSNIRPCVLRARWAVLKAFNEVASDALELVNLRRFEEENSIAHMLCSAKALLVSTTKMELFEKSVQLSFGGQDPPELSFNRGTSPAESRKRERTLVWQAMQAVEEGSHPLTKVGGPGESKQAWLARFEGEGGMDYGGLYRDSLREMCAELQCQGGALQLFLPCPNQRMATGSCQDRWLPNPAATSSVHMRLYRFVGMLMGASIRTDACIELDLPAMVWKQLVGEECLREDVAAVDEVWNKEIQSCLGAETKEEFEGKARAWVVKSLTGRVDDLVSGGAQKKVLWEEREAFVAAQVQARVGECRAQVAAIQEGFLAVIPSVMLPLLTWRELEKKVCGTAIIDVDELEKNTEYQGGLSKEHPLIIKFWKVVKGFSQADLAALLAFVWGRKRMPVPNSGDHLKIDFLSSRGDGYLPQAHTCFFAVDLPDYSTEEVMSSKLMYAIYGCAAIDNDMGNPNGTLYESDEESEAEEAAIENLGVVAGAEVNAEKESAVSWLVIPLDHGDGNADLSSVLRAAPKKSGSDDSSDDASDDDGTHSTLSGSSSSGS